MIKCGDWYVCPNCNTQIFDTSIDGESPTKAIEKIEALSKNSNSVQNEKTEKKKNKDKPKKSKKRENIEFLLPIIIAFIIAVLLKTLVFANAVVPTGSMLNTIHEKDRIIASRLAYIKNDPERYDIVIFRYPDNEKEIFVKRVIGLPGERINIKDGIVFVTTTDGQTIQLEDDFVTNCVPEGNFGEFVVPEDSYFMMGDNRNSSWDSRFWTNTYVHKSKILGKVKFRYYPTLSEIK